MEEIITEKNFREGLKVKFSSQINKNESRYTQYKDEKYGEIVDSKYGSTFSVRWSPKGGMTGYYAKEIAIFEGELDSICRSIHEIIEEVL